MKLIIVIGAALFAAAVGFMGHDMGWPFLIGFYVGAFVGWWNHDLVVEDPANQQREAP